MALYHFSAKIISRGKGESACAAAAYRSATKITNEYDGQVHDYRRKQSVTYSTILLPDNAPGQYADRATLWNAVEAEEKQSNAQLAREIEFALPLELDEKTRERIALEFVQDTFVKNGMIADVNFHNPPKKDSRGRPVNAEGHITRNPDEFIYTNPHVHVQLTLRPIDANGKWEKKKQKRYVVEKKGKRKALTNEQIKEDPGWEKLYNFKDPEGKKSWETKSYANEHPELTQINRYPKAESVLNPKVEQWNSSDTLRQWRAAWSEKVNTTFLEIGISEHIDHRSYADQGLDLVPTVHLGKQAMTEEKRLQEKSNTHTDLYMLNQAIKEHNTEVRLLAELRMLYDLLRGLLEQTRVRIKTVARSLAEKLERLRAAMIVTRVREIGIKKTKDDIEERMGMLGAYINNDVEKENLDTNTLEERLVYNGMAEKEICELKELTLKTDERVRALHKKYKGLRNEYEVIYTSDEQIEQERQMIRAEIESEYFYHVPRSQVNEVAMDIDKELGCEYQIRKELCPEIAYRIR